jgi:hypothetical protein
LLDNRPQHPEIPREPMPGLPYPDIFSALPEMPRRVYIVGSGPNGAEPFKKIPEDAFTIALNSAVTFWRPWDWWMCFDHRVPDSDWWCDVKPSKRTKRLYGARLANRVWSDKTMFPRIEPDFLFRYHPGISGASFVPGQPLLVEGLLRGLTVCGCALQFAYYCGAEEAVLCGVDMNGQLHVGGHVNIDEKYLGVWPWAANLSRLCAHLKTQGMAVKTISETALTGVELFTT